MNIGSFAVTLVSFAVALGVLVFVHELGHFLAAKSVGARATKFYVGFPPALLRRRVGDTEYGIGAIPLGGYVRIVGMTRPQPVDLWRIIDAADEARLRRSDEVADDLTPAVDALERALKAQRLGDARRLVDDVLAALDQDADLLMPLTLKQARKDLTRMRDELDPRAYWALAVWRRVTIIAAGPFANVVAAVVILAGFYMTGEPTFASQVDRITNGSPAASAGLRSGDVIVGVGNRTITSPGDVAPATPASGGKPVVIRVQRDGAVVALTPVAPRYSAQEGRYLFGIQLKPVRNGTQHRGPIAATGRALDQSWVVTSETITGLKDVVTPQGAKQLTTPVGNVESSSTAVTAGYYPGLLAFISLALAIFNLLPFLPLDGGHILFALAEKVYRRPIPRVVFERVSVVGIVLMLMLFTVGLNNDIGRLGGP
jgi:regulator of sigma E protease